MKKIVSLLLSSLMVISIFASLPINTFAVKNTKKVSLKKSRATLKISKKNGKTVYGTTKIKVKKAKGVTLKKVTYKSLKKSVASVSKKGKVTAKAKGKTSVKVKVAYKFKKRAYKKTLTFKVTVKDTVKKQLPAIVNTEPETSAQVTTEPTAPWDTEAVTYPEASTSPRETVEPTDAQEITVPETENTEPASTKGYDDIEGDTGHCTDQDPTEATDPEWTGVTKPDGSPYYEYYETTAPATEASSTAEVTTEPETKPGTYEGKLSAFSNKLYSLCSEKEEGNYVMSPASVYMALSMLYEIGDENVRADILELTGMDDEDLQKTGDLYNSLTNVDSCYDFHKDEYLESSRLDLSNSIWIDNNLEVNMETLKELADKLYCESHTTTFKDDNEAANKAIREFIKEKTNGLIDKDFDIQPDTLFSLINTLYFKDIWNTDGGLGTTEKSFSTENGIKNCEFLCSDYKEGQIQETDCCYYFYTTTFAGYRVKLILPKEGHTLAEAMSAKNVNKVNADKEFDYIDADGVQHFTSCVFPSFKIESDTPLKAVLESNDALSHAFEMYYSPLTNQPLKVSDIKHSTVLDVNKEGIEGAAVTIIDNTAGSAVEEKPPVYHNFVLNREFGFIITDTRSVVLFEGQVKDPAPEKEVVYNGDLDFSLNFNYCGESSYDGSTGLLTKTTSVYKRKPVEFKTYLTLNDEQKKAINEALNSINLDDYPDNYDPFAADKNPVWSTPSETIVLRIGKKTVTCNNIAFDSIPENEKGKKLMTVVHKIKEAVTSSKEWRALPEFEFLVD